MNLVRSLLLLASTAKASLTGRRRTDRNQACEETNPLDTNDPDCFSRRWGLLVSYYPTHSSLVSREREMVFLGTATYETGKQALDLAAAAGDRVFGLSGSRSLIRDAKSLTEATQVLAANALHSEYQLNDDWKDYVDRLRSLLMKAVSDLETVTLDKMEKYDEAVAVEAANLSDVVEMLLGNATTEIVHQQDIQRDRISSTSLLNEARDVYPRIQEARKGVTDSQELVDATASALSDTLSQFQLKLNLSLADAVDDLGQNLSSSVRQWERISNDILRNMSTRISNNVTSLSTNAVQRLDASRSTSDAAIASTVTLGHVASSLINSVVATGSKEINSKSASLEEWLSNVSQHMSTVLKRDLPTAIRQLNQSVAQGLVGLSDAQRYADLDFIEQAARTNRTNQLLLTAVGKGQQMALSDVADTLASQKTMSQRDMADSILQYEARVVDLLKAAGQGTADIQRDISLLAQRLFPPGYRDTAFPDFFLDTKSLQKNILKNLTTVAAKIGLLQPEFNTSIKDIEKSLNESLSKGERVVVDLLRNQSTIVGVPLHDLSLPGTMEVVSGLNALEKSISENHVGIKEMSQSQSKLEAQELQSLAFRTDKMDKNISRIIDAVLNDALESSRNDLDTSQLEYVVRSVANATETDLSVRETEISNRAVFWKNISQSQQMRIDDLAAVAVRLNASTTDLQVKLGGVVDSINTAFKQGLAKKNSSDLPVTSGWIENIQNATNEQLKQLITERSKLREKLKLMQPNIASIESRSEGIIEKFNQGQIALHRMRKPTSEYQRIQSYISAGLEQPHSNVLLESLIHCLDSLKSTTDLHLRKLRAAVEAAVLGLPLVVRNSLVIPSDVANPDLSSKIAALSSQGRTKSISDLRALGVLARLQHLQSDYIQSSSDLHAKVKQQATMISTARSAALGKLEAIRRAVEDTKNSFRNLDIESQVNSTARQIREHIGSISTLWVDSIVSKIRNDAILAELEGNRLLGSLAPKTGGFSLTNHQQESAESIKAEAGLRKFIKAVRNVVDDVVAETPQWPQMFADRNGLLDRIIARDDRNVSNQLVSLISDSPVLTEWDHIGGFFKKVRDVLEELDTGIITDRLESMPLERLRSTINEQIEQQDKFEQEWLATLHSADIN